MNPDYITFSNIIIDDIVLWDGRTFMGTLGGSGTHALIGMRVWSDRLGFVATVGKDFAPAQRTQLEKLEIDLRGVVERDGIPTARAWQIFEPDERRIEIMRTDLTVFHEFEPYFENMPPDYQQAKGFHVQWGQNFQELIETLGKLRAANPAVCLVWEPSPGHIDGPPAIYQELFSYVDLFSPDIEQAELIAKQSDPQQAADTFLSWGAPRVAIRMGAKGSLVGNQAGQRWSIPAVSPRALVDVTGAGNAYCGGFVVGLGQGLSDLEAALRAAVSASFAIEQFGVPDFDEKTNLEADRRLAWARENVTHLP